MTLETVHTEPLIQIGVILTSFGIRGELVVSPMTDDPDLFLDLDQVYVGSEKEDGVARVVESARIGTRKGYTVVLLKLESVSDRDQSDSLRGKQLFVDRSQLSLREEEYLLQDLIGLEVKLDSGDPIGRLKEVRRMPGQDLLVIDRGSGKDLLIPDVPEFVGKGSIDDGFLVVYPIDGLID